MKPNIIILVSITLFIAAGAYWYFFVGRGNQPPLSSQGAPSSQTQAQFETLVNELQSISFNTAIFSDARFNALVDITTAISLEPSGRPDPLAPIPGVGQ